MNSMLLSVERGRAFVVETCPALGPNEAPGTWYLYVVDPTGVGGGAHFECVGKVSKELRAHLEAALKKGAEEQADRAKAAKEAAIGRAIPGAVK